MLKTNSYGGQVRSYTSKASEVSTVSEVSKMSKQGEQQSLHSLRPLGEGGRRPDEGADVPRHKAAEPASCKSLVPQCPVLDLLHAHGDSPEERCSSRLVPFAIRTRFAPSVRKSASHLITSKKAAFTLAEGRPACTTTQVAAKGGQVHSYTLEIAKEVRSTIIHDVTRLEVAEPKTCNHLFTQSLSHLITSQKAAFTLAEVLITLAVIGVVAVLTIPGLIKNHNEKAWSTAQDVFTKRLEVATRQMNTEEKLAGYDSTMDFVNELKKYIKITRVCDNSEITKCFNKQVIWNEGEEPIDMSTIKNAQSFGLDWESDTVAVQFANGVNAVIAYNPNATQDPFNNQFSATSNSMAILYDVSGNKNPNTNGKDIGKINVTELADVRGCLIPELQDTMCITQILAPGTGYGPMTRAECEQAVQEGKLGIKACYNAEDYWAGAVAACGGIQNMPNLDQLKLLHNYIYNKDDVSTNGTIWDTNRIEQFLLLSSYADKFHIWSGNESIEEYAYIRSFLSNGSSLSYGIRTSGVILAVCLEQ